jgi:ribonuclease P protein subunit POP4
MITPKNLIRHELIGLKLEIEKSKNKSQIGIRGKVIDETKSLLVIKTEKGIKKIEKTTSEFVFRLPDGRKVKVNGKRIAVRPEERIKLRVKKW